MKTCPVPGVRSAITSALIVLGTLSADALEPRQWLIIDGRSIEAELTKVSGNQITLLDKEGRTIPLDKNLISFGDLEYVRENFPEEKKTGGFAGFAAQTAAAAPNPAKLAKIDTKLFKRDAGTFSIDSHTFQIVETPHFKIMYQKPADPMDVAELAERLWHDTAFFHTTFPQKFRDRKMAIFIAGSDSAYDGIGSWYAQLLDRAGHKEAAAKTAATWPRSAAGGMRLTREFTDPNNLIEDATVFRAHRGSESAGRQEIIRGVWNPFRVHCLAKDLLQVQSGGVSSFGAAGFFAITTGHGYYKEILLTGKSETSLLRAGISPGSGGATGVDSTGGFKDARSWPAELKRRVRKGDVKPTITGIYQLDVNSATEVDNVLAYSFARYLQRNTDSLLAFNKLIEQINTSNQVPEPDDLAKLYGLEDSKALEADWIKYITSAEFR